MDHWIPKPADKISDANVKAIFERIPYHLRKRDDGDWTLDHPKITWDKLYEKMTKQLSQK